MPSIFWFRRDLRLADNPALNAAIEATPEREVYPLYALSIHDFKALAAIRQHSIYESLKSLDASLGGTLSVAPETPAVALVAAAKQVGATAVFATRAFDPAGVAEQNSVGESLAASGIALHLKDSYYAVLPGTVAKPDLSPYRVYTPFFKAWFEMGWPRPYKLAERPIWKHHTGSADSLTPTAPAKFKVKAGEEFALRTWARFKNRALEGYDEMRNRADLSGTSHLSHALAFGEIHPRTLLAQLGDSAGHNTYRKEIAWREFYADVLWHNPHTVDDYYDKRFADMQYDTGAAAEARLTAWQQGKTGYPMVDAGMRQLLETGWMHNRVRMIVASFLVKDLHIEWQHGARWFEQNLSDFDPASNSHGWQWTAGCGTDASPYYRVFNPILQGYKFDPEGEYVRKFVPELRHIEGPAVHEPSKLIDGLIHGYPVPIVDHFAERDEALARLEKIKLKAN
jgi:deoxyribodipyrimidine photo-lyase